jgi:phytoene dehydrogenase-like protein
MLLQEDKKFFGLSKKSAALKPSHYPFTLHLGVYGKGIPEKMSEYVIFVKNERKILEDCNLLFLEVSAPSDEGRAPKEMRAMSVTTFLDKSPASADNASLKETAKKMLGNLEHFLPFLKEHIAFMDIEKSIEISIKQQKIINNKYRSTKGMSFGISTLSNKTPMKNVFLTGGALLPGLGFDGEIISGINAARIAAKR